ncbi:MAG: RcnB family protein [Sphingobium sp.]
MLRKVMLAGLMAATTLGGITPAAAQSWGERMRDRMEQPSGRTQAQARPGGDAQRGMGRSGPMAPRPERPAQNWQQRAPDRPAPTVRPSPQPRADSRWNGNDRNRGGEVRQGTNPGARPDARQQWRDRQNDDRRASDNRQWDNQRRADNDRRWNDNRRNDRDNRNWDNRNWNDNRNRNGGWAANGRFDDRTRWNNQRRWDNGWRNDRRYDWRDYRARYGDRYRVGRYYAPRGWDYGYRRFSVGIFLGAPLYANSYWLDDPWSYRLPPAYGTLRWVRYYDDALLVDIRDGYVVDVIHDFFW